MPLNEQAGKPPAAGTVNAAAEPFRVNVPVWTWRSCVCDVPRIFTASIVSVNVRPARMTSVALVMPTRILAS